MWTTEIYSVCVRVSFTIIIQLCLINDRTQCRTKTTLYKLTFWLQFTSNDKIIQNWTDLCFPYFFWKLFLTFIPHQHIWFQFSYFYNKNAVYLNYFLETVVNLISELITERLTQSHVSSEGQTSLSATLTIAEETSQMAIDDGSSESRSSECSSLLTEEKTDFLALRETPFMCQTKQLKFLADSYNRTMNEEKNFPKVIFTGIAIK